MDMGTSWRSSALGILVAWGATGSLLAQAPSATTNSAPGGGVSAPPTTAALVATEGLQIIALAENPDTETINGKESRVGLNGKLWVILSRLPPGDVTKFVLFLNDEEIKGLDAPVATTYRSQPALLFKLKRNSSNDAFWRALLGSPHDDHINVAVSVGERSGVDKASRIAGSVAAASFGFQVFTRGELILAAGVILIALGLVWSHARSRTTLRDNLLPQLAPSRQPFSLGRSQMAFWFTLIFASFVVLFLMLQDVSVLTTQALALMGISGCTAAGAIAVDVAKNSPADDANRALQALGIKTYEDVQRLQQEILDRQKQLRQLPPSSTATAVSVGSNNAAQTATLPPDPIEQRRSQLQIEINDRNSVLRVYDDKTLPFISQGWFKDVTTDINGPTVHRLQVVCWTVVLGGIFVFSVYRNLAMPEYNGTLLALMGISSAGYVGFKCQEVNN